MYRTPVRESGRRIALLVLILTAAGGASGDRRSGRPRRDHPLSRPADGHPDGRVLGRAGHRRAASSATRTSSTTPGPGRSRSSRSTTAPRATTRASSSSSPTTRPTSGRWSPACACRTPSSSTPRTATSTSRWPPSASTRWRADGGHRRAGRASRPRTASASPTPTSTTTPVVHAGHVRRHAGQLRRPDRRCAACRSARPTSTTTATPARRSRSPACRTGPTGSGRCHRPQQRLRRGQRVQQRDRRAR